MKADVIAAMILLSCFATGQGIDVKSNQREECIKSLSGYDSASAAEHEIPTDLSGIEITYSESGCYGKCPSYSLVLREREAEFDGHIFTRRKGKRRAELKSGEFAAVVRAWFDSKFYAMRPDYCQPKCPDGTIHVITDVPGYSVEFKSSDLTSGVYVCSAYIDGKSQTPVPPASFYKFQKMVRDLAKSHGWL